MSWVRRVSSKSIFYFARAGLLPPRHPLDLQRSGCALERNVWSASLGQFLDQLRPIVGDDIHLRTPPILDSSGQVGGTTR